MTRTLLRPGTSWWPDAPKIALSLGLLAAVLLTAVTIANAAVHGGSRALRGALPTAATWKNVSQTPSVASHSTYIAEMWLEGAGPVELYVKAGSWGANLVSVKCTATAAWSLCATPPFSTGANTKLTYIIQNTYPAGTTLWIDDTFLGPSGAGNRLANPGFENGSTSWNISDATVWSVLNNSNSTPTVVPPTNTPRLQTSTPRVPTQTSIANTKTPVPPTNTPISGPGTSGPYHVSGNAIYNVNNVRHRFHGVDRSGLEVNCSDGSMTQQDFYNMRRWNANVVRIPLNQDYWLTGAAKYCSSYAANVDAVYHYAVNAGLDVIFDLHWSDAGNLGNTGPKQQMMPDQNSLTFWKQFAAKYANIPFILFEMYNEPHSVSWNCWLNGCTTSAGWQAVGMQQVYNTIRGTGANNIVLAGGLNWAYDLSGVPSNRIRGLNIAYVTHPYDFPDKQPAGWDSAWGFLTATDPVIVTEFGDFNCTSGYYSALIAYAQSHNQTSWTAWAWVAGGCGFPSILASSNGKPSSPVGVTIQSALQVMPPN